MGNIYRRWRPGLAVVCLLMIGLISWPLITAAKQQYKKVTDLTAAYNEDDAVVRVSWEHTASSAHYQVKVLSGGEKITGTSTSQQHADFEPALFTYGHDYTIQVRVKPSGKKTASGWKKITYTHTVEPDPCPTDGISHEVYVTSSTTPTSFPGADEATFTKASVPDAIQLQETIAGGNEGDVLAYFVRSGLCMSKSEDNGLTWSDPVSVAFANMPDGVVGAVDPSLVQLSNGKLRLFFFGSTTSTGDPAQQAGDHVIYSATSEDGANFTLDDGERLARTQITDPEVIKLGNTWIMYLSLGSTSLIATATDGLNFTLADETWSGGGIPGAYVDTDQVVHIYGCSGGVNTATSTDGLTFGASTTGVIPVTAGYTTCDPSPVLFNDGTILMVYKKQADSTGEDSDGSK